MTNIDASMLDFRQLNAAIRDCAGDAAVTSCSGQRFIGAGLERGKLILSGTPGNALGAYLNGRQFPSGRWPSPARCRQSRYGPWC